MDNATQVSWDSIKSRAFDALESRGLDGIYRKRLLFELNEVEKQGANGYWTDLVANDCRFDSNPNHLVLPWLIGMIDVDPIAGRHDPIITTCSYARVMKFINEYGKLPPEIIRDVDNPDIDIDCLPEARDPIKEYATKKYSAGIDDGYGAVCSVGTWMTYLLRSAIKDVAKATVACDQHEVDLLTKELPDEVDDMRDNGESSCKGCKKRHREAKCPDCGSPDTETPTIGRLLDEHPLLRKFNEEHPETLDIAVRLVGRIRAMGKHAGALIIADRPLFGNIPMSLDTGTRQWKSLWTEGRNTQLSKLGYTKWDILGLKNLRYIYEATRMVEQNHGISFGERTQKDFVFTPGHKVLIPSMSGWDDINPDEGRAGHYFTRDGEKVIIELDDPEVMRTASESRTDAVFQFDTDLAKRTLSNGVRSFNDLLVLCAMGHPGPIAMIPEYVARRDDHDEKWRQLDDPRIVAILAETFNVIVYQEQLQSLWQNIAGFTAPEAQEARKAVAKKWREKLKPIEEKWMVGASKIIGEKAAADWWTRMVTFGRYAFNKSHAVAYCRVAFQCLWLKTYFPHEWWSSVMSYCNSDKLIRYMNVARAEGVEFATINIDDMTLNFVAKPDSPRLKHTDPPNGHVSPGLICLKGIGAKVAGDFVGESVPLAVSEAEDSLADAEKMLEDVEDYCYQGHVPGAQELGAQELGAQELTVAAHDDVEAAEAALAEAIAEPVKVGPFESVDDFVARKGKQKLLMERLIKLGSFKHLPGHGNTRAVWDYYLCKYCSGTEITALKKTLKDRIYEAQGWNEQTIAAERGRQESEFRSIYPKRKVPKKILEWKPKVEITLEGIAALGDSDYKLEDILKFEEQYLGYHLHSPLDLFITKGGRDIPFAISHGEVEAVIVDVYHAKTKTGMPMCKLTISDGIRTAPMMIWADELASIDKATIRTGRGIRARVNWDDKRRNFVLQRNSQIVRLKPKDDGTA